MPWNRNIGDLVPISQSGTFLDFGRNRASAYFSQKICSIFETVQNWTIDAINA